MPPPAPPPPLAPHDPPGVRTGQVARGDRAHGDGHGLGTGVPAHGGHDGHEHRQRHHGGEHDTPPRLLGGDLLANATELAQARSVVLLVGSLVRHEGKRAVGGPADASLVPGSVDGPAGAIALARALVSGSVAESSGCSVVVVTDEANADVVMAGVAGCGVGGKQLRLEALAAANEWGLEANLASFLGCPGILEIELKR